MRNISNTYKKNQRNKICKKNSLNLKEINGVSFNPIIDKWDISNDKSVNYITKFKKN